MDFKGYSVIGKSKEKFGASVSAIGDFNNDGLADLAVGYVFPKFYLTLSKDNTQHFTPPYSTFSSPGSSSSPGSVVVVFGSTKTPAHSIDVSSLDGVVGTVFVGINYGDKFGYSVGPAGDYNLDGVADMIVGAPTAGSNGVVYVLYGQSKHFPSTTKMDALTPYSGTTFPASSAQSGLGHSVWGG